MKATYFAFRTSYRIKLSNIIPLLFVSICCYAQQPPLGLERPATRWMAIDTRYAKVIYEPGAEQLAYRSAALINKLAERDSSFIGGPSQRIPVILHGNSVLPAGVPNLAPIRSDWTITAPQTPFMGTVPWIDLLSIHEYRHHQQMQRAKKGWFTEISRGLMGQTGWFINVLAIQPTWFFEGDATYTETVLTNAGRGRTPLFDMEYRALRLSGKHYNYEKASKASRRDFVPNIYRQGYYMTAYARKQFGVDVWTKILEDTYKRKGFFYPFTRSVKKYTGMKTPGLYDATMQSLDSMWQKQDSALIRMDGTLITAEDANLFTSYKFPQYTSKGILAEKSSFNDIRSFVLLNNEEDKLFRPGNITSDHVNLVHNRGRITWAENTYHPRWGLEDYSVLYMYDLERRKKHRIARRSKYYSPAPSNDGASVVAIRFFKNGTQQLELLDVTDGHTTKSFRNPDNAQLSYPRFGVNDQYIYLGATTSQGNYLRRYNVETGEVENLLHYADQVITRPFDTSQFIYFSATFTGINNIYAYEKATGNVFQVTSSRFGAYMPAVNAEESKLIYSDYTANGYMVREIVLDQEQWWPYKEGKSLISYIEPLDALEGGDVTTDIDSVGVAPSRYRPGFQGLLNFHTWTPFISENEFGINVISNNIFQNTALDLGVRYNINDNRFVTTGKISYGALFPVFDLQYQYNVIEDKRLYDAGYNVASFSWFEHNVTGGVRLPFKLSRGTFNTSLLLDAGYTAHVIDERPNEPTPLSSEFGSVSYGMTFSNVQSRAARQLNPRWGQAFALSRRETNGSENGFMSTASGQLNFPGFARTHAFFLNGRYREENLQGYRFEDRFNFARGYNTRLFADKSETDFDELFVFSGNYELPVIFPDWDLKSLAYFRAISANVFYDHSEGTRNQMVTKMRSAGLDINVELIVLRLLYSRLTLRTLYRFDQPQSNMQPVYFNFVFEVLDLAF